VHAIYAAGLEAETGDGKGLYSSLFELPTESATYLTDKTQSLFRIANGVRLRKYSTSSETKDRFPTPQLQYTVRMQPRDARALRLLLQKQGKIWGSRFGVQGFNSSGRAAIAEALWHTRLRQNASNQVLPWEKGGFMGVVGANRSVQQGVPGQRGAPLVPSLNIDGAAHATPLGYLYAAMLLGERDYKSARTGQALLGTGSMAGCSLPDAFSVRENRLFASSANRIVSGTKRGHAIAPYQILMKRAESLDGDVQVILRFARDMLLASGVTPNDVRMAQKAGELLLDGKTFLNQALWKNPLVVEAFALGHIDPAVVPIWRCMALRAARGVTEPFRSINARNVAYDEIDRDLMSIRWSALINGKSVELSKNEDRDDTGSPRFFAAAHNVTRLLGVGLIDAVELYDGSEEFVSALGDLPFDTRCAGWTEGVPDFIPRGRERNFLRDMNFELFRNINLPVVRELKRTGMLFDPVDWRPLVATSKEDADFEFDLRMVIVEQGHIENFLSDADTVDRYGLSEDGAYDRLTNSQLALYCSQIAPLARRLNTAPNAQFQVLGDLHTMLKRLEADGVLAHGQVGFRNYIWRVATGSAYVHVLHRKSEEDFLAYMRRLIADSAKQIPTKKGLTEAQTRELRALVTRPVSADPTTVDSWTEGLATYLKPDAETLSLFDCSSEGGVLQELIVTPVESPLESRKVRIQSLLEENAPGTPRSVNGLSPVVIAFELSASGNGALVPNAKINADPDNRAAACEAVSSKRQALDALMQAGNAMSFLYSENTNNFIVMDRSRRLAETQVLIEPFLMMSLDKMATEPLVDIEAITRADLHSLVQQSLEEALVFARNQALAGRLSALSQESLNDLGLYETSESLEAKARASSLTASIGDSGDAPLKIRIDNVRIDKENNHREDLSAIYQSVCVAIADCENLITPSDRDPPVRISPIQIKHDYPELTKEDVINGRGTASSLPSGASLKPSDDKTTGAIAGSNLYYSTTPTGDFSNGKPIYEAELTYRLPLPTSRLEVKSTADSQFDPTATPLPDFDGHEAVPNYRDIPLGIVFTQVERDEVTGSLDIRDSVRQDVALKSANFIDATSALGVPGFIDVNGIYTSLTPGGDGEIDDLNNITVYLSISLFGEPLDQRVGLTLVENGVFKDPVQALRTELIARIESEASEILAIVATKVGTARLPPPPADLQKYSDSKIRFGPIADRAVDVQLDWDSETLTARLGYALGIDTVNFLATADLLVSSNKISVQKMHFDTNVEDLLPTLRRIEGVDGRVKELEALAETTITTAREVGEVLQSLQVYPVIRGTVVRLNVRHSFILPVGESRCTLSIQAEASLDYEEAFSEIESTLLKDLEAQVARCSTQVAVTPLAQTLDEFLDNPEFTFFGTKATIRIEQSRNDAMSRVANTGILSVLLDLNQSEVNCKEKYVGVIEGAALQFDKDRSSAWLEFTDIDGDDAENLSAAIACQLEALLPLALKSYLTIDGVQLLGSSVLVDASIRNLPILSDVRLERINLSDPKAGLESIRSELKKTAVKALSVQLSTALKTTFGEKPIDIAGIGSYRFENVNLLYASSPWWIELRGTLSIGDFNFPDTMVRIPVGGKLSDIDVRVDNPEGILTNALAGALQSILSAIPGAPEISNLYFGRLNPNGSLYGFRFGVKFGFPLGGNRIDLEIREAELSTNGLSLGGEITAAIPTPLYFGPVALSQVLLTLVTGEKEGARSGLKLGADLTAVEPQFARVLKLRSMLDLTNIDRLAFSLRSDVIALDSIGLMWAEGTVDFSNAYARFDAEASELVKDIVNPQMHGELNGKTGLVFAESKLDVLGVELNKNSLQLCSKDCVVNGVPGEARLDIAQDFLIGKATGGARLDLAFEDPGVSAGIDLDLFGWNPGGADFTLNLGGAETRLSFLGMKVTILTPSYQTMDPGFVARVLQDLLKIDISDFKKLPKEITISLMTSSGDVQTTKTGEDGSDGNQGKIGKLPFKKPETLSLPNGTTPDKKKGTPPPTDTEPPRRPEDVAPPQQTWGKAVTARVCERYQGPEDASAIPPEPDHFYFVYGLIPPVYEPWKAWLWPPWNGTLPEWYTWPGFAGPAASKLCDLNPDTSRFEIPQHIASLGAARISDRRGTTCNADNIASSRLIPLDETETLYYQQAGLPILCFDQGAHPVRVDSRLYFDTKDNENPNDDDIVLVPLCPPTTVDDHPGVKDSVIFKTLCRDPKKPIIRFRAASTGYSFNDVISVINAREELRFYEQVVFPHLDLAGSPGDQGDKWESDGIEFSIYPDEVTKGGDTVRVNILIETTGANRSLEMRRLTPTNPDGTPSRMFALYKRAKGDEKWRGIFLTLYSDYLIDSERDPEFVTKNIDKSDALVLLKRDLDRPHVTALRWIWVQGDVLQERLSFVPTRLPTLDGPIRYGIETLRSLADMQKPLVKASSSVSTPLRSAFYLSDAQNLQFRLSFPDPACALKPPPNPDSDPCSMHIAHVAKDTVYRIAVVHTEDRSELAQWIDTTIPDSNYRCASNAQLREGLRTALRLSREATPRELNRLFSDVDAFTAESRNFNKEPLQALRGLGACQ